MMMLYDARKDRIKLLLLDASRVQEARGWCQWESEDPVGAVCISRAIYIASKGNLVDMLRAREHFEAFTGLSPDQWNDERCKSKEEAVGALRRSAHLDGCGVPKEWR